MNGMGELLRTVIRVEHDVFDVRQRGREVAVALGLTGPDVIRLASALSEVGRRMHARLGPVTVVFAVASGSEPELEVTATAPDAPGADAVSADVGAVRQLVDTWRVDRADGLVVVRMTRRLPVTAPPLTPGRLAELAARLAWVADARDRPPPKPVPDTPARLDELRRVNAELAEANERATALYRQLSEELAETNRGVVALYAELDQRSAELREANEAKSRFLANISHELRAPVTAILGLVRLLRDPRSDPLTDDQREQLALLEGSADDLLALVSELLDLVKAESGRLEPRWSTVDLPGLFGALRGTMRSIAARPDGARPEVEVVVEEPPSVPVLRTDEAMLTRVLRNLMTNAIKFTEHGEVRLAAHLAGGDRIAFTVSDTGIGIAPVDHERIFEEFYQVSNPAQAKVTGTGLGLPYARRLVTLLGGALTLTSEVGRGSTFTVTLPLVPEDRS